MSNTNSDFLPTAFFKGEYVPIENATVPVMTNALQYGAAIFGGVRGYHNKNDGNLYLFRLDAHAKRFVKSLKLLGVDFDYSEKDFQDVLVNLASKNKPQTDVYYRPFAYNASLEVSPNIYNTKFDFTVFMIKLGDYIPTDRGINVKVSSFRRITDNSIASRAKIAGGYINSSLAKKEAQDDGYDEAIFLTEHGTVSEGSAMNLFIVRNGKLITPAVSEDILEGITRDSVMKIAKDLGIEVEERIMNRTELYVADEVFFSGTGAQIAWIKSIDKRTVGNGDMGPITRQIREKFFKIVRGEDSKYMDWCTKVNVK